MPVRADVAVTGMDSESNADEVRRALDDTAGVEPTVVSAAAGRVEATVDPSQVPERQVIRTVVEELGYGVADCERHPA
ncbi:heavy-metal-associated domain-containing protein [Halobacteriaceae archaeon GCM10025711]